MYTPRNRAIVVPLIYVCLSGLWIACSPGSDEYKQKLRSIQQLIENPQQRQVYIFEEGGEETDEETQWSRIKWQNGRWAYLELYNQFEREDGQQEYNLYEFHFDPSALGKRFPVLDYELRVSRDSNWFALPNELQAGLDGILTADSDTVFRILGYAHKGDDAPGHIRYWSPDYGTLLVWFGSDRFFELIEPYPGLDQDRLGRLKALAYQDVRQL